jgi:cold shock CspA family protein
MFGTIVRLNLERGFGFIASTGEPDYFFHCRELRDGLVFNEQLRERRVRFSLATGGQGLKAVNVFPLEDEPPAVPEKESTQQSA